MAESQAEQNIPKKLNKKAAALWIALFVIIALFAVTVPAYFGQGPYSKKISKIFALPAAFVNGQPIRLSEYYARLNLAKQLQIPVDQVLPQMILDKKAEVEASKKGIVITDADLESAYQDEMQLLGNPDFSKADITSDQFKNDFVKPELVQRRLAIWLASQRSLNLDAYQKMEKAQEVLNSGTAFEDAAKTYSDDTLNAAAGGDMGFVSRTDVYPEIYSALSKISDHDLHVVYSRLGIHLIEVLDSDNNGPDGSARYHLRQIFIKTQDFGSWLQSQKFSILKLV